ncbi:unnamed protein product, partial [Phaeothamnion confervicola]
PESALEPSSPQIRLDLLRMIVQYLHDERFFTSAMVVQDEANMRTTEQQARRAQSKRLRKAVIEGAWEMAVSLVTKTLPRQHHKRYLYALYRQEYLELIERQEYQKAFAYLNRRLKPMESTAASTPTEFQSLCYLLTCKSVGDAPHFRGWQGVMAGRERLADDLARLVELESGGLIEQQDALPPHRLLTLVQQAVAYQIEFCRYHPRVTPRVSTLARDFQLVVVPNRQRDLFVARGGEPFATPVKCIDWVGPEGFLLVTG